MSWELFLPFIAADTRTASRQALMALFLDNSSFAESKGQSPVRPVG